MFLLELLEKKNDQFEFTKYLIVANCEGKDELEPRAITMVILP